MKSTRIIPHKGLIPKVMPLNLFQKWRTCSPVYIVTMHFALVRVAVVIK